MLAISLSLGLMRLVASVYDAVEQLNLCNSFLAIAALVATRSALLRSIYTYY